MARMVMVLIAGTESLLLAALATSVLVVLGQGSDSFSAFSQWALYAYAATLAATVLAHMLAVASSPEPQAGGPGLATDWGFWGLAVASTSDAQCAVAFLALVCYTVAFSKSVVLASVPASTLAPPRVVRGGPSREGGAGGDLYSVSPRDSWYMAVVGDAYSSWVDVDGSTGARVSSLYRLGPNGTTASILAQAFSGAVIAYLLVMLMAAVYTSYTASNRFSGFAPRLFMDSRSLSTCNVFVVMVMREAVEVGFQECRYAGLTANSVGALLLVLIFVALDGAAVYSVAYALGGGVGGLDPRGTAARAWFRWYSTGVTFPTVSTIYACIPTLVALSRNTSRGDEPVLVASISLCALATASAWARYVGTERGARQRATRVAPLNNEEVVVPDSGGGGGDVDRGTVVNKAGSDGITVQELAVYGSVVKGSGLGERVGGGSAPPARPSRSVAQPRPQQQQQQQQQQQRVKQPPPTGALQWTLPSRDAILIPLIRSQQQQQQQQQKHGRYVA